MDHVPAKNTPMLAGWVIAAGVAAVATGLCIVVFGFNVPQATFVAAVLFVVVGVILGLPGRDAGVAPPPAILRPEPLAEAPVVTPSIIAASVAEVVPVTTPSMIATAVAAPMPPVAAQKPQGLTEARGGKADDLKIIKGIGPSLEKLCHKLGYYHFDQIAAWTPAEVAWVDDNLEGFKGRVTRDAWVAQARVLAAGGTIQ